MSVRNKGTHSPSLVYGVNVFPTVVFLLKQANKQANKQEKQTNKQTDREEELTDRRKESEGKRRKDGKKIYSVSLFKGKFQSVKRTKSAHGGLKSRDDFKDPRAKFLDGDLIVVRSLLTVLNL